MKYTMIGLTLFLMISSASAGTLTDDFSDRNMNEWTKDGRGNHREWRLENGELIIESNFSLNGFSIGEVTWKDYTVGVSLKIVKHRPFQGLREGAALSFRATDVDNSYYFGLVTLGLNPKQAEIFYFNKEVGNQSILSKLFAWEMDTWYDLKVTVKGNSLECYINEELIWALNHDLFTEGKVGIGVGNSVTAHFDNFFVMGDDVPDLNLSVSPKGKLPTMWGKIKKL